jgi:hypothetical protein
MKSSPAASRNNKLVVSLGLHSAAIIAFQLALMQLLSVVQWHHFAYMIISVAMLGFGASGTLLALYREKLVRSAHWLVPLLMSLSGMFMMVAFPLIRMEVFAFDAYLLFVDRTQFVILAANYFVFFIPFFTGALSIGIIFICHSREIGVWYFSNLLGSGLGGLAALLLLSQVLPQQAPAIIGLASVLAGLISMVPERRKWHLALAALSLLISGFFIARPGSIPISQYKSLARTLTLPDAEVIHRQPGIHGLVEVVSSPALRFAPALSLSYTGDIPVKKKVFVNGDFYGVIPGPQQPGQPHILNYSTQQLPYVMSDREQVLVLHAASGVAIAHALANNASRIEGVIENRDVIHLMQDRFAEASGGLFHDPQVNIHRQEARHYLAAGPGHQYDLIALPLLDAFGGTSGLNALRENYALTLEAFELMWDKLSAQGAIMISSWMDYPSRTTLKVLATLAETARQQGISNPADHLVAVRSWGTITFVLTKEPVNPQQSQRVMEWCRQMFFDPVLLPGIQIPDKEQFNMLEDQRFFNYVARILEGDQEFYRDYSFSVVPATDNKPYFFQFLRLNHFGHMANVFGQENVPLLELGYLIVLVTLAQSTFFAIVLIILPLLRLRRSPKRKTGTLLYFGALGLGYMFAEIILIQRFVLYFGQPVYAIAAVITTMLIFSGAGSLYSEKFKAVPASVYKVGLLVAAFFLALVILLTPALQQTMALPLPAKAGISLLLIGIPAFFMGMLFPLGIRFLAQYDSSQIPWAWGINGCLSVISTSLATLIAVDGGFQAVILIAVISYLLAALTFFAHQVFFREKAT